MQLEKRLFDVRFFEYNLQSDQTVEKTEFFYPAHQSVGSMHHKKRLTLQTYVNNRKAKYQ